MKFSIEQSVAVEPAVAAAAYANPAFYEGRPERNNISVLEVVRHERSGDNVLMEVHFRFSGSVSSAVRAVVDPKKMSWITRSEVDLAALRSNWTILPDHYPDRLTGRGSYIFTPGPSGAGSTTIQIAGELKVHVPLFGGTVERVIVSGLRSYIAGEVEGIPDVPSL
jgi:hypothetical protein